MTKIKFALFTIIQCLMLIIHMHVQAQDKKSLVLDELFTNSKFHPNYVNHVNWMKDGNFYTRLIRDNRQKIDFLIKYRISDQQAVDTIFSSQSISKETDTIRFSDYSFGKNEDLILLTTNQERIYRRSTKADFLVYDLTKGKLTDLFPEAKESYATFSPDGSSVAFVSGNNLFYKNLASGKLNQVTTTGKFNEIIHGSTDWVYEEEFALVKGFEWSPDSKKIAYYTFDESAVNEYNMQVWSGLYPSDYRFKYPKAGEENSKVAITIYDTESDQNISIDIGEEIDVYIPKIKWTTNPALLSIIRLNRLQNKLDLLHANAQTGNTELILTETSNTYIDYNYNNQIVYLEESKGFVRTSEQDGWKHVYHYEMNGDLILQITNGNWLVDELKGVDEKNEILYYLSTEDNPLERQLYRIRLNGKQKKQLTEKNGVHDVDMSPDFNYYLDYFSSASQPLQVTLHKAPLGKLLNTLEDNQQLKDVVADFQYGEADFFTFTSDGAELKGYLIKPYDFDPAKKYPLLLYVYGGPGSQNVKNQWSVVYDNFHNYLAQEGFIIACVDNRGTGGRGRDFQHSTYGRLGDLEVKDQINAARFLATEPFIDDQRIGIWGWSYGGYMSSLALMIGNEVFKSAIAVAPVTSWRFYDTIYTERFLKTPQLNPEGYDAYSPLSHVEKLEGDLLLIHGTGDDNVHFQNSVQLQDALINAGKQFESFYYPNKDHSIGGKARLHLYQKMTEFLKRTLLFGQS